MERIMTVSWIIYGIGMVGIVWNRRSIIRILMSIELMLIGVNMSMMLYSIEVDDVMGEVFGIYILTVAGAETAIGLGIMVTYYKIKGEIGIERVNEMQG